MHNAYCASVGRRRGEQQRARNTRRRSRERKRRKGTKWRGGEGRGGRSGGKKRRKRSGSKWPVSFVLSHLIFLFCRAFVFDSSSCLLNLLHDQSLHTSLLRSHGNVPRVACFWLLQPLTLHQGRPSVETVTCKWGREKRREDRSEDRKEEDRGGCFEAVFKTPTTPPRDEILNINRRIKLSYCAYIGSWTSIVGRQARFYGFRAELHVCSRTSWK